MGNLTYANVDVFLVESIPEFRDQYESVARRFKGERPGQYIIFGALENMTVKALDQEADAPVLRKVFECFEEMASSCDIEVVNLLQVGFIENLVSYPQRVLKAWQLMGPETRKLSKDTARIWNRTANLP